MASHIFVSLKTSFVYFKAARSNHVLSGWLTVVETFSRQTVYQPQTCCEAGVRHLCACKTGGITNLPVFPMTWLETPLASFYLLPILSWRCYLGCSCEFWPWVRWAQCYCAAKQTQKADSIGRERGCCACTRSWGFILSSFGSSSALLTTKRKNYSSDLILGRRDKQYRTKPL